MSAASGPVDEATVAAACDLARRLCAAGLGTALGSARLTRVARSAALPP